MGRAIGVVPKPCAPKTRLKTVDSTDARRSGIAIDCSKRLGLVCWVAVKFREDEVISTLTGHFALTELTERDHLKHPDALQRALESELQRVLAVAVIDLGVGDAYPVHRPARADDGFGVYDALARLGIPVSSATAPAGPRAAAGATLARETIAHIGEIKISTDASFRRGEPSGHGWFVESASVFRPLLGSATARLETVLEAELFTVRRALKFARDEFGKEAMRANGVLVRCDSALAVRMLQDPTWSPREVTKREALLVKSIHEQDNGGNVRFVWVRGHNGDLGNEFADRLAVAARRLRAGRVPHESAVAIMSNIFGEATERFQLARHGLAA
ncbi:hypothetical protein BJH93_05300 [Kocuria polaris]|nr:hypothetical protein [Kocuria polaris]